MISRNRKLKQKLYFPVSRNCQSFTRNQKEFSGNQMQHSRFLDLVRFLEANPTVCPKYIEIKNQVLDTDATKPEDIPESDLTLVAQAIFMRYEGGEVGYEYDSAEPLDDKLLETGKIVAWNSEGDEVLVETRIGDQADQNVYMGTMTKTNGDKLKVVIKWVDSLNDYPSREGKMWTQFAETCAQSPSFWTNFQLFGYTVFVIEELQPIERTDDFVELGVQILDQLQKLHTFGCHADLKPGNIMKKGDKFYLIDMGSISTDVRGYGYTRSAHTPHFTSQTDRARQIITAKYDLLELGFVLNWMSYDENGNAGFGMFSFQMQNARLKQAGSKERSDWWRLEWPNNHQVKNYMNYINEISEVGVTAETYQQLKQFLQN